MKKTVMDINEIGFLDLAALPWVGSVMAEEIYNYRQTRGAFREWDELKEVPGVTAKTIDEFKRAGFVLEIKVREAVAGAEPESGRCVNSTGSAGGMGSDDVVDIWDAEFVRR